MTVSVCFSFLRPFTWVVSCAPSRDVGSSLFLLTRSTLHVSLELLGTPFTVYRIQEISEKQLLLLESDDLYLSVHSPFVIILITNNSRYAKFCDS